MIIYVCKNQYKLILVLSNTLSFCFRDRWAQKAELWSLNTELQPKDRSIIYALKWVGSLPVLKYFTLQQAASLPWHAPAALPQLAPELVRESLQDSLAASILPNMIYKMEHQ